jgi:hypothetical protein
MGGLRHAYTILVRKLQKRYYSENLCVNGEIIMKLNLKYRGGVVNSFIWGWIWCTGGLL